MREEVQQSAEILINEKLTEAERAHQELQTVWQKQFEEAKDARKAAEQTQASLQVQMQQLRQDSTIALESAKAEAKAREAEIRTEANRAAESAVAEKIAAIETARRESETALQRRITEAESSKIAAEKKGTALLLQLDELQKAREAEVAKMKEEAGSSRRYESVKRRRMLLKRSTVTR